jgi:MFS family permease
MEKISSLTFHVSHRTRALLLLPLCANAGTLIGPLLGGLLASNSAGLSPSSFSSSYPYALPNLVIAIIYAIAAFGVIFGVEETLEALQDGEESFAKRMYHKIMHRLTGKDSGAQAYSAVLTSESQSAPLVINTHELPTTPTSTPNSANPLLSKKLPSKKRKLPFHRMWTFNVICTMLSHFIVSTLLPLLQNKYTDFVLRYPATLAPSHPCGRSSYPHPAPKQALNTHPFTSQVV